MVIGVVRFMAISFLIILGCGIILFPSFSKLRELKEKERFLSRRIDSLKQKIEELEKEENLAKSDPNYREFILRKNLGLLKEGEYLIKIERK